MKESKIKNTSFLLKINILLEILIINVIKKLKQTRFRSLEILNTQWTVYYEDINLSLL